MAQTTMGDIGLQWNPKKYNVLHVRRVSGSTRTVTARLLDDNNNNNSIIIVI